MTSYRVFKKNFTLGVSIKSPATNMLEGLDVLHLKGGIHSPIWSTKTFLYDIRELRYKPKNMGYQSSQISSNEQSNILKSDTPRFMYNFLAIKEAWTQPTKGDIFRCVSSSNLFLYNIKGAKILADQCRTSYFTTLRLSDI